MNKSILSFLLVYCSLVGFSQNLQKDTVEMKNILKKANLYLRKSKHDSSILLLEEAKILAEKCERWDYYFNAESWIIENLWRKGDVEAAAKLNASTYPYAVEKLGSNSFVIVRFFNLFGTIHLLSESYDSAIYYFDKLIKFGGQHGKKGLPDVAAGFVNKAYIYYELGDYVRQLESMEAAYEVDKKRWGETHYYIAEDLSNIGSIYSSFNLKKESLAYLSEGINIMNQIGVKGHLYAGLLLNMGYMYGKNAELNKSLNYLNQALVIYKEIYTGKKLAHSEADYYIQVGDSFKEAELYDSALWYLTRADHLFDEYQLKDTRLYSYLCKSIAECHLDNKNFSEAHHFIDIALAPYALSDNEYYRDYINIKGLIFLNEGKHEDAITYFNKSISSYQNKYGPDYHVTSSIYVNLARAYFGMDRFDTSLECIQKALALNADSQWKPQSTLDNPPEISPKNWIDYFNTLTEKLTILQKVLSNDEDGLTKLTAQYAYIDRCVKMCRREISDTYDQFTYDDSFEKVYAEAINTSYDLYVLTDDVQYLHQCFYWLESHRGSTLLQSARTQFAMKNTDLPAEVVQAERELESQLALMKSALQSEVDTALLASYSQREFKLKYAYDSLISRIEQDYPSYVESKYNDEVVSVEEAQEQLARDEALIAFNVHDTTLFSFYLTREEFEVKRLTLDSTFDRHLQTLFDTYKDAVPYTKESMASSKYVYDVLIGTYEEKLNAQAIQTLTLMPDDQLHYLPFDALLVSYADGPSHLVEHVSSRNIYSVTIDQYALTTNKSGNKVLALAPAYEELSSDVKREFRSDIGPLLWNGEEVDNISQYFDTKQLKGMLASERSFKSEVANHDIIHLAMHALVDEGNFRNSKLILEQVPDSIEDGNLYLSELFLLDIQASLAVLSACETGIGTLSTANGPMSLSSAFHYAGVPSVAMSYWNVDDQATSTLMSSFYANLAAGMIKSEALRQAKLTYLQTASPDKRHPFYWASFSILGNDDPVVAGSGSNMWYIILVLIVIACSGYAFVKKKA